jgi:hypothetical protein
MIYIHIHTYLFYISPVSGCVADTAIGAVCSIMFVFIGVTRNTLRGCALIHAIFMALGALQLRVMPNQWERSVVMIECCIAPTTGIVAGSAVCAKLAVVGILCGMTGVAICGRAFINTIAVAGTAWSIRVQSGQREAGIVVVESHIRPRRWDVAGSAACAKLAIVSVPGCMTGITIFWRSLIHIIGVT